MKRIISVIVLAVMVLALGTSAAGCKSEAANSDATGSYADAIPGGSADVSAEVIEALTRETTISTYHFFEGELSDWEKEFVTYYKEVYNGTIEYVPMVWEKWEERHLTNYAAGDSVDLIYLFEKNFPKYANRGMVYSVEEMTKKGVVGFDHPVIQKDYDLVSTYYKYKGDQYTFATNMAEADMIFVNTDLFKKYNVKSPVEYYNEGTWNWETFEKCASELTRDTDGDEKNDIFGYYAWDGNFVVTAAGGEFVRLKEDGKLVVGLEDTATIQGLENYANIYGRLKCAGGTADSFGSGNAGMIAWMPQNEVKKMVAEPYTFKWDIVPYPLDDRTNPSGLRSGKSYAWCVSSTCADEQLQGCINYIIAQKTFAAEYPNPSANNYNDWFTAEQLEMINDCTRKAVVPIYQGVGNLWSAQWDFWGMVKKGGAASEIVASYKSLFEAQVELENNYATQ